MASLFISEASFDAKSQNKPLHMATLDSQKAFDVVSHPILLDKLYHTGVNLKVWSLVKGMYKGLSSRVKLEVDYSHDSFPINQGVRQGGTLSTHLYKIYINDLLLEFWLGKPYILYSTLEWDQPKRFLYNLSSTHSSKITIRVRNFTAQSNTN